MTQQDLAHQRHANHRPAVIWHVEEVGGNIPATCRYFRLQLAHLLHLAPPLRGRRPERVGGSLQRPAPYAHCHPG